MPTTETTPPVTSDVIARRVITPGRTMLFTAILVGGLQLSAAPGQGQSLEFEIETAGSWTNGEDGIDLLDGVDRLNLNPDGDVIYASSCRSDSVGTIRVDLDTGNLTGSQVVSNGNEGIHLDCPTAIGVSPDGLHTYISGHLSNTLVEFDNDPVTGLLSPLFTYGEQDGVPERPLDIGIPANGGTITVASWNTRSLTPFRRSVPDSGPTLRLDDTIFMDQPVEPAAFPTGLTDTTDGLEDVLIQGTFPGDVTVIDLGARDQTPRITSTMDTGCSGMQETGIVIEDGFFIDPGEPVSDLRLATVVTNARCGIFETPIFADFHDGAFDDLRLGDPARAVGTPTTDHLTTVGRFTVGVNNPNDVIIVKSPGQDAILVQALKKALAKLGDVTDIVGSRIGLPGDEPEPNQRSIQTQPRHRSEGRGRLRFYATHPSTSTISAWNLNVTCKTGGEQLCLGDGRYYVAAKWQTKKKSGRAQAVQLTEDTGYFWFFDKDNVEVVLKVHDGCGFNDHQWIFAGGLTDVAVDIRVEDLLTGEVLEYGNQLGRAFQPVRDIEAFHGCLDTPDSQLTNRLIEGPKAGASRAEAASWSTPIEIGPRELGATVIPRATCKASDTTLCINQDRFQVEVDWATKKQSGQGHAVEITPDTGYFWFFGKSNIEMVIKVFDGCGNNNNFWVFAGGLTDVEVDITVTDMMTGRKFKSHNPRGSAFRPIRNISSFPCS